MASHRRIFLRSPMRRVLDAIYTTSGWLAAFFIFAIAAIVLLQVAANLIDAIAAAATGEALGLVIPSYADFAGFFLAASSFLALAYTLRSGGHIRVNLFIRTLNETHRQWVELWCAAVGAGVSGYFTWFAFGLMLESIEFGDLSPGMVPVPLWIPQSAVTLGLSVLTIAFVDELLTILNGRRPSYRDGAAGGGKDR